VTVAFAFSVLGGLAGCSASQVSALADDLPQLQHNITGKIRQVRRRRQIGLAREGAIHREGGHRRAAEGRRRARQKPRCRWWWKAAAGPGWPACRATLGPIADVLATAGLVVVLVIFMLIERQRLLERSSARRTRRVTPPRRSSPTPRNGSAAISRCSR